MQENLRTFRRLRNKVNMRQTLVVLSSTSRSALQVGDGNKKKLSGISEPISDLGTLCPCSIILKDPSKFVFQILVDASWPVSLIELSLNQVKILASYHKRIHIHANPWKSTRPGEFLIGLLKKIQKCRSLIFETTRTVKLTYVNPTERHPNTKINASALYK